MEVEIKAVMRLPAISRSGGKDDAAVDWGRRDQALPRTQVAAWRWYSPSVCVRTQSPVDSGSNSASKEFILKQGW